MSPSVTPDAAARAVEVIRDVLPGGASIAVEQGRPAGTGADRGVDLVVNEHRIEIKWIGEGRLGDARRLLQSAGSDHLVAVARQMSLGARELLQEHGVGWVDETGAAEIAVGMILVSRTGRAGRRREPNLRWTSSVLATAEALMCGTPATVSAVQDATGLSAGSSTNALRTLSDRGLLESDSERGPASGRRVSDLDALLAAYTTAAHEQPRRAEIVVGALWRDPIEGVRRLGDHWDRHDIVWAASGTVASALLAPVLTNIESALVYIDTSTLVGLEAAARAADLAPIEGGRLTLRPFPTVTTLRFASAVHGVPCAPWPRVYADLQHTGVRGEEAADHLREVMTSDR